MEEIVSAGAADTSTSGLMADAIYPPPTTLALKQSKVLKKKGDVFHFSCTARRAPGAIERITTASLLLVLGSTFAVAFLLGSDPSGA